MIPAGTSPGSWNSGFQRHIFSRPGRAHPVVMSDLDGNGSSNVQKRSVVLTPSDSISSRERG